MLRIILSGANGAMGRAVTACVNASDDAQIVAGVDTNAIMLSNFPVFSSFEDITCEADVIIDFSHPSALASLLDYSQKKNIPAVIATTGLSDDQIASIKAASEKVALFFTFNMSLGINLLVDLARRAASVLYDSGFDIEIIEKHHNQKLDAPSGTAIMLANGINDQLNDSLTYVHDRHSRRAKRPVNEIGIHAVRGGTIVGEHEVMFAGRDEIISLSHSARSKEVFAVGAFNAARFIADLGPGLYSMSDLIASK